MPSAPGACDQGFSVAPIFGQISSASTSASMIPTIQWARTVLPPSRLGGGRRL